MGRPQKLNVSAANAENVAEVVSRTLKKVRAFTKEELAATVAAAYKSEENVSTEGISTLTSIVLADLVTDKKVTEENGNYKVVVGKRGRPKKVTAETAVAAQ